MSFNKIFIMSFGIGICIAQASIIPTLYTIGTEPSAWSWLLVSVGAALIVGGARLR